MQGNEVKPQKSGDNFQHRDKEKFSTIRSRVQGKEIKSLEDCDSFQHRDKKSGFSREMAEDQTHESRV